MAEGAPLNLARRAFVAALLACVAAGVAAQAPRPLRVSDVRASIVLVDLPGLGPSRTGVVLAAEGLVVVAFDGLVAGAPINVRLRDGRSLPAKLVSADAQTRTAVLRIEAAGLATARVGDPAKVGKGAVLVSLGYEGDLARGTLLGRDRSAEPTTKLPLLEASLPNNDHPVYNAEGELVGFVRLFSTRDNRALVVPVDAVVALLKKR